MTFAFEIIRNVNDKIKVKFIREESKTKNIFLFSASKTKSWIFSKNAHDSAPYIRVLTAWWQHPLKYHIDKGTVHNEKNFTKDIKFKKASRSIHLIGVNDAYFASKIGPSHSMGLIYDESSNEVSISSFALWIWLLLRSPRIVLKRREQCTASTIYIIEEKWRTKTYSYSSHQPNISLSLSPQNHP